MANSVFQLSIDENGLATVVFDHPERRVNVFDQRAIQDLDSLLTELEDRDDVRCAILASAKPGSFIVGADVEAIAQVTDPAEAEEGSRLGHRLFGRWDRLPFPTIVAVRGTCLGGGMELSLASSYLVLSDREDIRVGLPEIKLGIVPGWGGCIRLPRKVGLAAALDAILAGKSLRPAKAFKIGLADALVPDATFEREVRRFAENVLAGKQPRSRRPSMRDRLLEGNPLGRKIIFDQARKQVLKSTKGHYPAPLRALEVVRTGLDDFDRGLDAEARAIGELAVSPTAKNLIHLFHLMEAAKSGGFLGDEEPAAIGSVGVLGAGVMGGGIAQLISDKKGLPVRLKDIGTEALAKGFEHAAKLFAKQVKRRWLSKAEARRKLALIRGTLDYSGFDSVDLVIEAIVENLDVKQKVFAELAGVVRPDCVLASNTSSLSIDAIGRDAQRPERVVGMHFFNPVHKMPLVEVVVGEATSAHAADTILEFSRRLGKTPVIVKSGPGFLVNRLLAFTMAEAMWLLDEGHKIESLDRAVSAWGMPLGPCALTDEVGLDVAVKVSHILTEAFPKRLTYPGWMDRMVEDGRLGAKAQKGFYRYEKGRRTEPDAKVYDLLGLTGRSASTPTEQIADRILLPMANEAARCLEEGVVRDAEDLDLAMIFGTGFPPFRGGLCRWADSQGVDRLAEEMERWAVSLGERFLPSPAFREVVEAGGFYARHSRQR